MSVKEFDAKHDYTKDLKSNEIKHEGTKSFVFLKGLERLAKERGIRNALCVRLEQLGTNGVFCTYQYMFEDNRLYQGSADATTKNCDGNFKLYLTAMAESRAKARALRTAFGISMCSVEEKSDIVVVEDADFGPIGDEQLQLIKHKAKEHSLGKADILSMLEVPRNIPTMKKLTREEGREIIGKLNKYVAKMARKK